MHSLHQEQAKEEKGQTLLPANPEHLKEKQINKKEITGMLTEVDYQDERFSIVSAVTRKLGRDFYFFTGILSYYYLGGAR